jgi:hypothetical protein
MGEEEGGLAYCEVEYDAPDIMAAGMGLTYMINSIPTLLSFDSGEVQTQTRISDGRKLSDKLFLEEWLRTEARRRGDRGGRRRRVSGDLLNGLFGRHK